MTEGVSAMHQTSMAWRHLHRKDDIWPIVKTHWGKQLGKESNFNSQNWKRKCENKNWNHGIDTAYSGYRVAIISLLSFLHCTWNDVHPPFHLHFFIPLKNSSFYPGNRQNMLPFFTSNRYRYKKWNAAVNRPQSHKERVAHHFLKQGQEISTKGTTPGFEISNPSDSLFG